MTILRQTRPVSCATTFDDQIHDFGRALDLIRGVGGPLSEMQMGMPDSLDDQPANRDRREPNPCI
ncbi:hypothetical protein [Caulobacter sp. RL271]|uniref:Uncharacterized protein n=1 Tax=Caulobacter segnis TaxID=88688 RepID=A0ABY4ZTG3_9CAUL|nr:hypothetical protein [Caulobacter segnis]USQ95292.1 hypothetical protein MZV50_22520 [Caulobacter segnis]